MVRRTVLDILEDFLGDDAEEIYERELHRLHIKSIIDAPIDLKHQFVQNVVTKYLDFSSEKTAGIYHDLLDALGIAPRVVLVDQQYTQKKGPEDIILEHLDEFWDSVYGYIIDYEVILNLYWKKGAEAVLDRMEYTRVMKVTEDALEFARKKLEKAFRDLLDVLHLLSSHVRMPHRELFSLLNETIKENVEQDSPVAMRLYRRLHLFWLKVQRMVNELEQLFVVSLNEEIKNLQKGNEDYSLIEALQMEVKDHWHRLSNHYDALRMDIRNDDFSELSFS